MAAFWGEDPSTAPTGALSLEIRATASDRSATRSILNLLEFFPPDFLLPPINPGDHYQHGNGDGSPHPWSNRGEDVRKN